MSENEDTKKFNMGKIPYWENIFKNRKNKNYEIIEILKTIPLFSTLNQRERKKVSLIVYERNYKAGEYLFKEGNPGSGMYIIKEGIISVERSPESGDVSFLANLGPGDFVGELALLDDFPRSASVRCMKNTVVVVFFRQDLFNLIDRSPSLGAKILVELAKMIGTRLRETNKTVLKFKQIAGMYKKVAESKK